MILMPCLKEVAILASVIDFPSQDVHRFLESFVELLIGYSAVRDARCRTIT